MSIFVDQNVLQFEISVDNVVVVQEPNAVAYLGTIEASLVLTEAPLAG